MVFVFVFVFILSIFYLFKERLKKKNYRKVYKSISIGEC